MVVGRVEDAFERARDSGGRRGPATNVDVASLSAFRLTPIRFTFDEGRAASLFFVARRPQRGGDDERIVESNNIAITTRSLSLVFIHTPKEFCSYRRESCDFQDC